MLIINFLEKIVFVQIKTVKFENNLFAVAKCWWRAIFGGKLLVKKSYGLAVTFPCPPLTGFCNTSKNTKHKHFPQFLEWAANA